MTIFNVRGCVTLIRTKEDKGVALGGPFDSKIFKNCQEISKIWSFLTGEVV